MGDILLDEQASPTTPASGKGALFVDNSSSAYVLKNDAGLNKGDDHRAAVAQIASFSADTYITNSGLVLPSFSMQAGMTFRWEMPVTKTAGTATPVYTVRIGSAQTTSDTSRLAITGAAQTAVADTGILIITVTCRSVGASGVLQGHIWLQHNLAATGFANTPAGLNIVQGTSAGFDNTALGGQFVGLSINPGASGAWVIEQVTSRVVF